MSSKLFDLLQLFRGILPARNMEELEQRLAKAQKRKDLPALVKIYYDMGVHCMKNNDPNRAAMYLRRSFAIYSSHDGVVKESLREDCFQRLNQLWKLPLLTNELIRQLEEQAGNFLDDQQIRLWGLLTMARLVKVGEYLSALPGCEVLGDLGQVTDLVLRSFQEPITQEEYQFLSDTCDRLYALGDDECFSDMTQQAEIPGGMPLQAFDLFGNSVLSELFLYINSHLRFLTKDGRSEPEIRLVPCALLSDYYLRTCGTDLASLPQIRRETERIQADYEFVRSRISWQDIAGRVAKYKELDVLTSQSI